jgi:hypothetical protein
MKLSLRKKIDPLDVYPANLEIIVEEDTRRPSTPIRLGTYVDGDGRSVVLSETEALDVASALITLVRARVSP